MTIKPYIVWKEMRAARHDPEMRRTLARTYWSLLVMLLMVTGVVSVAYGAWQFTRPLEQKVESDVTLGAPRAPLNRADIQMVLGGFDARSEQFEARRAAPPPRDPS